MRGQSLSVGLFGAGGFGFAGRASIGLEPRGLGRGRVRLDFLFDSKGTGLIVPSYTLKAQMDRAASL